MTVYSRTEGYSEPDLDRGIIKLRFGPNPAAHAFEVEISLALAEDLSRQLSRHVQALREAAAPAKAALTEARLRQEKHKDD